MGRKNRISIPGVNLESLNSNNRSEFGIPPNTKGVVVTESTGEAETFKLGVVIVEINGYQINTVKDVEERLQKGNNRFYVWYKNKYRFLSYRVP
jgi:S1-C subfamily serine protease